MASGSLGGGGSCSAPPDTPKSVMVDSVDPALSHWVPSPSHTVQPSGFRSALLVELEALRFASGLSSTIDFPLNSRSDSASSAGTCDPILGPFSSRLLPDSSPQASEP